MSRPRHAAATPTPPVPPAAGVVTALGPTRRRGPFTGWPLQRTLVVSVLLLFLAVGAAAALGASYGVQRALERDLDERVISSAERVARPPTGQFGPRHGGPPPGLGGDFLLLITAGTQVRANVVFTRDGIQSALTGPQASAVLAAQLDGHPGTVDLGGDLGRYRLVALDRGDEHRVVGLPTARLDATLEDLRAGVVTVGLTGLIALGAGTAWLIRAQLRPLERVAATATRVSTLPLSSGAVMLAERVPWADTDRRTEVGQVGAALNDLLDHVDASLRTRHADEQRLRQFVADASHELRTPLASISGYAELSRRETEPVPDGVRHALARIDAEAGRMTTLVNDLLLLARLDAGRPLEARPVDLTRIVLEAVGDAQVAGPEHHWRLDLPPDAVEVTGDTGPLTQVVVNLLANARAHTPPGTTVTTHLRRRDGTAVLEVADDGPGIDPELLPHVFNRFARGDASRGRAGGSTGLGLSIAAAVAAAHNGTVSVDSAPGRTRFTVTLPAT